MARSFHYVFLALGLLALVALPRQSSAQVVPSVEPAAPVATNTPPAYPEINQAIEKFRVREFDPALELLKTAAKKYPDLPPGQVLMFQLFVQSQQPYLARMALEKAVISDPGDPEAFVILANAALQERRVTEADLLYTKAKGLLDSFNSSKKRKDILQSQTLSGLAAVNEAREKWEEAQKQLEALLQMSPKDTLAMQRLARAEFQLKDAAQSLKTLRKAKEIDEAKLAAREITQATVLTPEATLAQFYEQFGDRANAEKWMKNALRAAPKDLLTRLVATKWALERGKIDEAKVEADEALRIDKQNLDAKVFRGVVALFQKDFVEAEKYFQDAHLQAPSNFAASNNLALALCEQADDAPKMQRAIEYASQNYQANTKNADAASTLGWVLYKHGDKDKAELALRQAAQTGNLSADTAYYLAQLYADKNTAPAKADARTLLEFVLKGDRPFAMKPEATKLLAKLKSEEAAAPAPKSK